MVKLIWDNSFKRAYKKRVAINPLLKKEFWDSLELFVDNPFDDRLRTHALTGKLSGSWAFSVDYDCRVVFQFLNNNREVLLIDIGTHDDVY